ncbi:hypothetical protein B0H14DRAFT_3033627 [Mycena olivaceomarginata]|nr:hypothetical protein B0H14DRAFT_3033627 [Mycena olivaceomarginata]
MMLRIPTHVPRWVGEGMGKAGTQDESTSMGTWTHSWCDLHISRLTPFSLCVSEQIPAPPSHPSLAPTHPRRASGCCSSHRRRESLRARRPVRDLRASASHRRTREPGARFPRGFSAAAGADVEVLEHGEAADMYGHRKGRGVYRRGRGCVSVEAIPPADAVTSASLCPDEETSLPIDADLSPRVRFVEPVVGATQGRHVESSEDDHDERVDNEGALLMTVSEGGPYRPLPECPSPAPES